MGAWGARAGGNAGNIWRRDPVSRPSTRRPAPGVVMARARHKAVWIDLGYFGSGFYVAFVPSAKAWSAVLADMKSETGELYPTSDGHMTSFARGAKVTCLVTIGDDCDQDSGRAVTSLLLHEAVHVFQELCDSMGEDEPSVEFEAYMIQHLYADLVAAYCDTRRNLFAPIPKKKCKS